MMIQPPVNTPHQILITKKKKNSENFVPKLIVEFIAWCKADRLLRWWIIGTLSKEALELVVGLNTALAVWTALKDAYVKDSQEHEFTLCKQIMYLCKE